jgi:hypothetical protein
MIASSGVGFIDLNFSIRKSSRSSRTIVPERIFGKDDEVCSRFCVEFSDIYIR